jgi:gluconolactonase
VNTAPGTITARFERLDERFQRIRGDRQLEVLHTGCRWTEGPAYFPAGRYLVFSDIPNDRLLRWDETTGAVGVFRQPSRFANGHTVDRQGRLVSCEHGARQVTRTEPDGTITVLADRYQGQRLNSPNDVVERADGSICACHVYRIDPGSGSLRIVASDFNRPNGLAFTQDERNLYICDSEERLIRLFAVTDDGTGLTGGDVFARCEVGTFDGIRLDSDGRVWAAAGDGLHCFDPDGTLLGKLHVPEVVANLTFGGAQRNQIFMCATSSVYAIRVSVRGARYPG